jgi:hypothetical protein
MELLVRDERVGDDGRGGCAKGRRFGVSAIRRTRFS